MILLWTMRLACWPFEVEGPISAAVAPDAAPVVAPLPVPPLPAPPPLPSSLPLFHQARYDIRYGILGSVGELTFTVGGVISAPDGSRVVKVQGAGSGAVLGLGTMRRQVEAEFDPILLQSRRWTSVRLRDGQTEQQAVRDTATRNSGGALLLERVHPGGSVSRHVVATSVPTLDPLGLLWRLRTAPPLPGPPETVHLLDGLALWRVEITTSPTREILAESNRTAIRFDGVISPIFYDGGPDPNRPTRRFTLWLSDAADHLPLRLEVPVGLADVVMTLAETHPFAAAAPAGAAPSSPAPNPN